MLRTLARKLKLLTVFVLIVVMVTPPVTLTAQPHVIEPFHVDHIQTGEMPHFQAEEQFLEAPDPHCATEQAMIDELLREQANLWMQEPSVRDALRFYELRNSSYSYSSLSEEDRSLILQQLDIAETAFATASELFIMMERDGLSLAKSIDVMVIVSGGLFSYIEAKQLIASIPNMIERNTEIMRFERLIQNFDIPAEVRARNLMNNSLAHICVDQVQPESTTPAGLQVMLSPERALEREAVDQVTSISTTPGSMEVTLLPERVGPSFDLARQLFLDGHGATEIQTAFALGAALEVEPEAFLLPPNRQRAQSAMIFVEDITHDNSDLPPIPQIPTPPRAVMDIPQAVENSFDMDAAELEELIEYGMTSMGLEMAPMSAPVPITHSDIVNNPFSLHFNAGESVNLNTGAAMYRVNVLSLPGRGGFGLNLDLVYNSADADLGTPSLVTTNHFYTCTNCGLIPEHLAPPHTVHRGSLCPRCWSAILLIICRTCGPSPTGHRGDNCHRCGVDLRPWFNSNRPMHRAYENINALRSNPHGLGVGWKFDLPYILNNVLYIPGRGSFALFGNQILNQTLSDMQLTNYNNFVSFGRGSTHRLAFYNGTSYFFAHSQLIGMRDRFGNTILFGYTAVGGWGSGSTVLSRITDTNGNHINFDYQISGNNRTMTIIGPDGSNFIIGMSHIPSSGHHIGNLSRLDSIQNQAGAVTSFTYDQSQFLYCGKSHNPTHINHTLLLRQVTYPSGAMLRFNYGWRTIGFGLNNIGRRQSHMVTSRELVNGGRAYQHTTFSYQRCHTGIPQGLHANHTYTTTITQNNGLRTEYTFNFLHLNTVQRTYNVSNVLQSQQTIVYGGGRLPINITLTEHSGGFSRTNTQRFYYNNFGQVTTAVSPLAQGSTDARYRTTTTYDARFGLPITTTFMPNASTTVRTTNRLSADGRSIVGTDIYENNVRMSRTDFINDQFGNTTEIREFPNATGSEFVSTQFTFDRGTMPTSIRTTNVRDSSNNLLGGTGIVERRFTYDAMWRVLSETDPMGYVTSWAYDRLGRVTQVAHPNGGFETYTYNDWANTLTHRTILGATYTHQFDGLGNLLTITDPAGTVILRNIYDNRMRVTETQNAQGIASSQRTVFFYDVFDRVTDMRRLNPAGGIMYRETTDFQDVIDTVGNRRITTTIHGDVNAHSIQNFVQYDRFGRRTQEGTIGGRILTYTYDLAGRVVTEQSLGINNTFTHNIFGVTSVRNIEGNTSRNTYDSMGRLLTATDLMGNTQRFTYDTLGRLIRQDVPFEQSGAAIRYATTLYFYDKNGNLAQSRTATNLPGATETWSITHNTFHHNRLMSSQTGHGSFTDFTYDLAGNILTQRVGGIGGATTSFTYNNRGQLTRTTDALGQAETFTYDANGMLLTRTDRNGTLFRKTYDHMGRLVREEAVQNGVVTGHRSYTYTLTGAVRQIWNDHHVINNYYDAQGRLIRQTETGGIVRTFAYNAANNTTDERVYVNGARHYHNTYTFDIAQRVHMVSSNGQLLATYAYNANGSRIRTTLSNGTVTEYTRNLAGLVTSLVNRQGNTVLSRFDYTYYLDGNTQRVVETMQGVPRTITYTYDTARRLTNEHDTGAGGGTINRAYVFDNRGNRANMTVTGVENYTVAYTYDLNNRLLTQTRTGSDPSVTTLTYDRNGNQLTSNSNNGRTETRTYNAFNQLIRTDSVSPYGVFSTEEHPLDTAAETTDNWFEYSSFAESDIIHTPTQLNSANALSFGWSIFNNGPGGTQYPRANPGLAASGTIRLWTQLNGANALISPADAETIVALDQNGHCAIEFVEVNRLWVAGAGLTDVNRVDVNKNGQWQYINLSITVHGQTVHVLLVNALFEDVTPPASVQITLNANGGTVTPLTITRYSGEIMGELPTPTRANYDFMGWYTAATGGTRVTASTIAPSSDVTYFAHWVRQTVTITITLNANSGTVAPSSITRNAGESMGELPTPKRPNHNFVGWYTAQTGGTRVTESTIVPGNNVTYFARWVPKLVSTISTYTYRADGLRHSKTVNGVTTYHIWNRGNIVLELDAIGTVINRFERGARGQLIRSQHHGWYLHDARGSVVQRVNAQGVVLRNYRYTAFGNEISTDSGNTNPWRFNGMYWDSHRSEYMTPNRMYSPSRGRWSQPDPYWNNSNRQFGSNPVMRNGRPMPHTWSILQAGNLYMFTMHDPVNFVDPSGLFAFPLAIPLFVICVKKAAAALAAAFAATTTATLAMDYAMHGNNSVVGQAAAGMTDVLGGGIAIPRPTVAPTTQNDTRTRSEPIAVPRTNDPPRVTPIYRSGNGNATNMTPRNTDVGGLSFYLNPPTDGRQFTVTTIEAVNATGVLRAVQDGTNHVSVFPVNPFDMPDWIASRYDPNAPTHALTHIMMAITTRGR